VARDIAVLTNPTAGKGRAGRTTDLAVARLRDAGFAVRRLQGRDGDEARDLAEAAVAEGVETLAVVGGDGLVHIAVQVLARTRTALGVIPAGTGNDAARYLDVARTDPLAATDVIVGGRRRTVDLARTGPTYFLCVLSAGFDAVVNERANGMHWPRGQMKYNLATLAELRTFQPIDYTLELDGETRRVQAMLVAVGNGASFGGGLRICEGADLTDGKLDVVLFHPVSKPDLVRTYPRLFSGTHRSHPAYEHHLVSEVTVAAAGITAYADGERLGSLPMTITSEPGVLDVLVGEGCGI
jgi:diacylglycerol kinase (ATP)